MLFRLMAYNDTKGINELGSWDFATLYVTGFGKRDLIAHFKKIELLLP